VKESFAGDPSIWLQVAHLCAAVAISSDVRDRCVTVGTRTGWIICFAVRCQRLNLSAGDRVLQCRSLSDLVCTVSTKVVESVCVLCIV